MFRTEKKIKNAQRTETYLHELEHLFGGLMVFVRPNNLFLNEGGANVIHKDNMAIIKKILIIIFGHEIERLLRRENNLIEK